MAQLARSRPAVARSPSLLVGLLIVSGGWALAAALGLAIRPALGGAAQACGSAGPLVYSHDFETAVGAEWSSPRTDQAADGRRFLGQFGAEAVALALTCLPEHSQLQVEADLFLLRSWDGNAPTNVHGEAVGPDIWGLEVAGRRWQTTFSHWPDQPQAYPDAYPGGDYAAGFGALELGTLGYSYAGRPMNTVYRLGLTLPHQGSSATLTFSAAGLQALADESWGLDSVRVYVRPPFQLYLPVLIGGAAAPTLTPTRTVTASPTASPTATGTAPSTPTPTATASATGTPTSTRTPTPTSTPTRTVTVTPAQTASATSTRTPTPPPTATATDTATPTSTSTQTATVTPAQTNTAAKTGTVTQTLTLTRTSTITQTATVTAARTRTPTPSASPTCPYLPGDPRQTLECSGFTPTPTRTSTATPTPTPTGTVTRTPTPAPSSTCPYPPSDPRSSTCR